ncbi:MAG: ATP synthase F1 subunit epsilon [Spirochaetaceae bacterium]|jgi:F-type H+-transporting ATPase subunit epsilon|nr:ATP synthase F1 subunit epsilon [Spirochaetaceae bacterium]
MAATFILEIYTPYRLFFSETVEMVILTITDGEIGIEAGRARFTAPVKCCVAKIKDKTGVWKPLFIGDGIIEVKRHRSVILVGSAEWPEEIDYQRVLQSKKDAEEILKTESFHFEIAAAKQKLKRAGTRLRALDAAGLSPASQ